MISLPVLNGCNTIPLTKGFSTLVDAEDYRRFGGVRWCVRIAKPHLRTYRYATRGAGTSAVYLHRAIAAPAPGLKADHRNHDTLDNRRANLRAVTHTQNLRNREPILGQRYLKGVYFAARTNGRPWLASIRLDGSTRQLGSFATEEDAARAYDAAALKHFGEYAWLNFPVHATSP